MELKIKDFEAANLTPEDVATLAHTTFRMTIAVVLALSRETAETLIADIRESADIADSQGRKELSGLLRSAVANLPPPRAEGHS